MRSSSPAGAAPAQVPFNEAPDMKAREITEAGKAALQSGRFQMVRVNYANPGAAPDCPQSP
jgi:bisphosphoglycerate-independent phosphoglycerate mutase (AlkP superfamily)